MNRNSDFFVSIISIIVVMMVLYGIVRVFANITYGVLYEDLVKEAIEEVVNERCVLK